MRRRITVTGPVDLPTAWGRYVEIRRWTDWAPQVRGVEASGDRLAPGLTGRVRAPLGVRVPFTVDEVDEAAHSWQWTVSVLGVAMTLVHDLTATPAGTRAGLTIDAPAPFALTYGLPARLALRRLCRSRAPGRSRS
ncbi:hypothetical protein [Ornithinimicrobium sufpigmenti]|uniref:hypothetical protein n=1 Tax=Ornithinimicrobium sufpigmenti TaxID=2508882 RepID=UPI00192D5D72|nr:MULTISPECIES: hypothetical protein [unclassified Ornithinimicrobium]